MLPHKFKNSHFAFLASMLLSFSWSLGDCKALPTDKTSFFLWSHCDSHSVCVCAVHVILWCLKISKAENARSIGPFFVPSSLSGVGSESPSQVTWPGPGYKGLEHQKQTWKASFPSLLEPFGLVIASKLARIFRELLKHPTVTSRFARFRLQCGRGIA